MTMKPDDLIYDWNEGCARNPSQRVLIVDETLRDGLQGGVPRFPNVEERLELLSLADDLGVSEAVVGFPATLEHYKQCVALTKGAARKRLRLRIGLLGRLVDDDIRAIARVQEEGGHPVLALIFVGASPIRRYVEDWHPDALETRTHETIDLAHRLGVRVGYGVEDGSRTEPHVTERLLLAAAAHGNVDMVAVVDTTGHLTPWAAERMVRHYRLFLTERGYAVRMDLHGHQDRAFGAATPIAAVRAGIDGIHCTALGLGERAGNYALEQVLVNLKLMGLWSGDLAGLTHYCHEVARLCGLRIPENAPMIGANAFRTQAGIHAAAICKAELKGEPRAAALVYSGVDPKLLGRDYTILVGPDSGRYNVRFVLGRHGLEADDRVVDQVLARAHEEQRILTAQEVIAIVQEAKAVPSRPSDEPVPRAHNTVQIESVKDLLERSAARFENDVAIRCGPETLTFRELNENVNRACWLLRERCGLQKGGRIGIFLPSSLELLYVYLGAMKLGAVATPFNVALTSEEMLAIAEHLEPSVIVASTEVAERVAMLSSRPSSVRARIAVGRCPREGWQRFSDLLAASPVKDPDWSLDGQDLAACLYTSGTTGRPKGILLSHGGILSNVAGMQAERPWELERHVVGCALPLHHVYPLVVLVLFPLSVGATVVLIPKFSPESCLTTMTTERITFFCGVPPMFALFNRVRDPQRYDLRHCKFCYSGAAPIGVGEQLRFKELFGIPVLQGYGLTETSSVLTWNVDNEGKLASVGRPLNHVQLKILGEKGEYLGSGRVGEVIVRGPNLMRSYYRNPAATATLLDADWFHTGDLGSLDGEGYLTLVGRKKDLIIIAGENVYPEEIDDVLRLHACVEDAAVVGIADPVKGQVVKAFVVRKPDLKVPAADLIRHCRSRLSNLKVPREFEFVEEIPRDPSGKILRASLA
jgi:acyl-CoA synthetase (AMP-forming)/AMP-acid ligase II/isopropylmalate/homocitrate/citramalate synthase